MVTVRFIENVTLPLRQASGRVHPAWLQGTDPAGPAFELGAVASGHYLAGEVAGFTDAQGWALIEAGVADRG